MNSARTDCRVCHSPISDVGSLGNHFINNFPLKWPYEGEKCPLDLVVCESCGLLQLKYTAPFQKLYAEHYWYRSGINKKIADDLKSIVEEISKEVECKKGDIWIDLGANDGTLLSNVPRCFQRVGIEPAKNLLDELKKRCDTVLPTFWEEVDYYPAKVITAIGMFYDSEDPNSFIKNVKKHLSLGGIFVSQLMMLKPMIDNNDVGNICHEHLEFYSYNSLATLFERNGLEIYKVEENDINGGSYRLFARHRTGQSVEHPETEYNIRDFFRRIEENKNKVVEFIKAAVSGGEKVFCYGASTKGNTILQYYNLGPDLISGVADANPEKIGRYTLTGIPIVSEDYARDRADYFFILPWGFTDFFLERESKWRENGGMFIVGSPFFKVL